jgi:hypothetical protein
MYECIEFCILSIYFYLPLVSFQFRILFLNKMKTYSYELIQISQLIYLVKFKVINGTVISKFVLFSTISKNCETFIV